MTSEAGGDIITDLVLLTSLTSDYAVLSVTLLTSDNADPGAPSVTLLLLLSLLLL